MSETVNWIIHIAIAVIIGVAIVVFVGQRTIVFDISMQPTLVEKDNLVVEKLGVKFGWLKPGDIIVFKPPQEDRQLVKRLVAIGPSTVEIKDGKVYVDDVEFHSGVKNEPETLPGSQGSKLVVPPGYFFAMGDNRPNSLDCREFGPVEMKYLTGRAIFRFLPLSKFGKLG